MAMTIDWEKPRDGRDKESAYKTKIPHIRMKNPQESFDAPMVTKVL